MARRSDIDWERVERLYIAGQLTIRQIADECGVSHQAITKRAKREWWQRGSREHSKPIARPAADRVKPVPCSGDGVCEGLDGFIYVFYVDAGDDRFYKIGRAKNPIHRRAEHQVSMPLPLMIACCYFTPNVIGEERHLHAMFANSRVRGEWFRMSDDDLSVVAARSRLV